MRQAIEEGFIQDVLKYFTTYNTYYIAMSIEEDPQFDKAKANPVIGKFLSLYPYNIAQKTQVMIEHFRSSTRARSAARPRRWL